MGRTAAVLLAGALLLSFGACGGPRTQVAEATPEAQPRPRGVAEAVWGAYERARIPPRTTPHTAGPIVVMSQPGARFASLAEAAAAARDGDVIRLGTGTYRGSVVLSGRSLTLEGMGADVTRVEGPAPVVTAAGGERVVLRGITLAAAESATALSVIDADVAELRLEATHVVGARGAGVTARGPGGGRLLIVDSEITGNLGGGISVSGGLRLERTLIAANGKAGVLFEGFAPGPALRIEHCTIALNGPETRDVAFAGDDDVLDGLRARIELEANVLGGELAAELVAIDAARLATRNLLVPPDEAPTRTFAAPARGDFRPGRPFPTDESGVEFGATLSPEGVTKFEQRITAALELRRWRLALSLVLRLPTELRPALLERVRNGLTADYEGHVREKRHGMAAALMLSVWDLAPEAWGLGPLLRQALDAVLAARGRQLKYAAFFRSEPGLTPAQAEILEQVRPARVYPDPKPGDDVETWQIAARLATPPVVEEQVTPLTVDRATPNPRRPQLEAALAVVDGRVAAAARALQKAEEDVRAGELRGVDPNGRFMTLRRRKVAELRDRHDSLAEEAVELRRQIAEQPVTFQAAVRGKRRLARVRSQASLSLRSNAGDTRQATVSTEQTIVDFELKPIREFGFDGRLLTRLDHEALKAAAERTLTAKTMATMYRTLEETDLEGMLADLTAARSPEGLPSDRDAVFRWLLLYAPRFIEAGESRKQGNEGGTESARFEAPTEPRLELNYDEKIEGPLKVRLLVGTDVQRQADAELADRLASRDGLAWKVLRPLDEFVRGQVDLGLDTFAALAVEQRRVRQ